jgi:nucleotide-binding universal stress UspA family protein
MIYRRFIARLPPDIIPVPVVHIVKARCNNRRHRRRRRRQRRRRTSRRRPFALAQSSRERIDPEAAAAVSPSYLPKTTAAPRTPRTRSQHARAEQQTDVSAASIGSVIVRKAEDLRASAIVLASHSRGRIAEIFLGSVTAYVLHHSTVPLLIVPHAAAVDAPAAAAVKETSGEEVVVEEPGTGLGGGEPVGGVHKAGGGEPQQR